MAKGLNGEIVLNARDIPVGRVDATRYGYRNRTQPLLVTVDIRIERIAGPNETIEHTQVTDFLDFALTTAVWQPGGHDCILAGATVEPLAEIMEDGRYVDGITEARMLRLSELGERWHLNGMQAGCAHVTPVIAPDEYGREVPSLDLTPACPITGYRYGHAWLVEPLPEGFLDEIRSLFAETQDAPGKAGSRIYDATLTP